MGKLALNFICKDESHVIGKMLESAKSITDLIVATDTGSTDGTQDNKKIRRR
jgi:glycosyltransferase involved in cell wall biosynthesis